VFPNESLKVNLGFLPSFISILASILTFTFSVSSSNVFCTVFNMSLSEVLYIIWFLLASPIKSNSIVSPLYPIVSMFPFFIILPIVPPPRFIPSPFLRVLASFIFNLFAFYLNISS
jgi:hypothetical protein